MVDAADKEVTVDGSDRVRRRIKRALRRPDKYCFVGAGLSKGAGVPGWKDLLYCMKEQLEQAGDPAFEQFASQFNSGLYAQAGDTWKKSGILDKDKQNLVLRELVDRGAPTAVHRHLVRLGTKGILTTNYDHLIENTFARQRHHVPLVYARSQITQKEFQFHDRFFIAKLHGDASNWSDLVIGLDDLNLAGWRSAVEHRLQNSVLLVFGVGGHDHIVNAFLESLKQTEVFFINSPRTIDGVKEYFIRTNGKLPDRMEFVEIEHSDLPHFLAGVCPEYSALNVHDTAWGRMPCPNSTMTFDSADQEMQEFLGGDGQVSLVTGPPGAGISSFMGQVLSELASRGNCAVIRQEIKSWLPLEAYVVHLLTYRNLLSIYTSLRREGESTVDGWTDEMEAKTVAQCLNQVDVPVYIALEHADRLDSRSLNFWSTVIETLDKHIKLILLSPRQVDLRTNLDQVIQIDRPTRQASIDLFAHYSQIEDRRIICEHLDRIKPESLHGLVFSGSLALNAISLDKIEEAANDGIDALCALVVETAIDGERSEDALRVLKTCAIFRTARDVKSIAACLPAVAERDIEKLLERFSRFGLLNCVNHRQTFEYAMSSQIRSCIDGLLDWVDDERRELSIAIGKFFADRALTVIEGKSQQRLRAIPDVATALFHYSEAEAREEYAQLVARVRGLLLDTYHFELLEGWVDDQANAQTGRQLDRADFLLSYTRARIDRIHSFPSRFKANLNEAKKALQQLKKRGESIAQEDEDMLQFEEGILAAVTRNYQEALCIFRKDLGADNDLRCHERRIQTLLSLGQLRQAEAEIDSLSEKIDGRRTLDKSYRPSHDLALLHRHTSTLCTLRLLHYKRRPDSSTYNREYLFDEAQKHAKKCIEFSREGRFAGVVEEIGVGIGQLKVAGAHYAFREFEQAAAAARQGTRVLSRFPNSRWWLMCCHDIEARALAMLHKFDDANRLLTTAIRLFSEATQKESDDWVRRCEFYRTEGLILLQQGQVEEAVKALELSVGFVDKHGLSSPCIEATHRADLARAQICVGDIDGCEATLRKLKEIEIQW